LLRGFTAIAATRPEAAAGPIDRNFSPEKVSAFSPGFFSSSFLFSSSDAPFAGAGLLCPLFAPFFVLGDVGTACGFTSESCAKEMGKNEHTRIVSSAANRNFTGVSGGKNQTDMYIVLGPVLKAHHRWPGA
jgi:hypothetical protein